MNSDFVVIYENYIYIYMYMCIFPPPPKEKKFASTNAHYSIKMFLCALCN